MLYRLDGSSADGYDGEVEVVVAEDVNDVLDDIEDKVSDALKLIFDINDDERVYECKKILNNILGGL